MILAGDVGGTKVRLALYVLENGSMVRKDVATFTSREFASLEEVATRFLTERRSSVDCACIGVPGPVSEGRVQLTNLPWAIEEKAIAEKLNIEKVRLVNDLAATSHAVPRLTAEQLVELHPGPPPDKQHTVQVVLAPGTGLGQGFLTWHDGEFTVHASEGGHVDFAPTSDIQIDLLQYLRKKFKRVSAERVLCGPGLVNIYSFLKESGYAPEPEALRKRMQTEDPAAVISQTGQSGEFEICEKALDIFVSALGAQAGDQVLTLIATGGVYLGGGIPPKILKKLSDGTLIESYLNKGRLSGLVQHTALYVIQDDHAALIGAAYLAASL